MVEQVSAAIRGEALPASDTQSEDDAILTAIRGGGTA